MRIGAYQFKVTGNIEENYKSIKNGIEKARESGVRLLLFPECALTGYPPHCIASSSVVNFDMVKELLDELQILSEKYQMYLVVGTIIEENSKYYNSAVVLRQDGKRNCYNKRALWGWDRDNFSEGHETGVIEVDSMKAGIRICFEVRFPEYFRELYRQQTDLNLILFYDTSEKDDMDRFTMIKGHIQTRVVENVCYTLACNTCSDFQTAPTILYDRSGKALAEMERGVEGLMLYDLEDKPLNFGELGRREISDKVMKKL